MSNQKKLAEEVEILKSFQEEFQKTITSKSQLQAQLTENQQVLVELKKQDEGLKTYKLIGPVLTVVENSEAKSNVEKRLQFIQSEIKRLDTQMKEVEKKTEEKKNLVLKLQAQLQQQESK
ncbi:hypothetical protein HDU92_004968 [Lobulomyces angularis]|nr:hypothetical protein HDU92_004968 [Lobulomyces angularis]